MIGSYVLSERSRYVLVRIKDERLAARVLGVTPNSLAVSPHFDVEDVQLGIRFVCRPTHFQKVLTVAEVLAYVASNKNKETLARLHATVGE